MTTQRRGVVAFSPMETRRDVMVRAAAPAARPALAGAATPLGA